MKAVLFLAVIPLLIASGCSSGKETTGNSLKISVTHTYIYSWLNLMPGGPSSFHITGNMRIRNYNDVPVNDIALTEVIISQDNSVIYKFSPAFETIHPGEDLSLKKNEVKEFRFNTETRLSILPELNAEKVIDAELIFSSGSRTLKYVIKEITIDKAY